MMLRPGAGSCSPLPGLRELWAKSSHECDMASCHNHKLTFLILRGGGSPFEGPLAAALAENLRLSGVHTPQDTSLEGLSGLVF